MSKLMELVDEYGFECLHSGDDEQRLLSEIRAAVAELERDAARYDFIANACEVSLHGVEIEDAGQIDAAMEAANVPER